MRLKLFFAVGAVSLVVFFVLDLWVGSVDLSGVDAATARHIMREFRLPKAVVAVLAGAALGASGLQMQTLFRNPLAGPYVLGISSGASLGVALFVLGAGAGVPVVAQGLGTVAAAWLGAGVVFLVIVAVSGRVKDILAVLIIGMMLGSVVSAVVEMLQYLGTEGSVKSFVVWGMGSLAGVSRGELWVMGPVVAAALGMALGMAKGLDMLMLGENYARTMGLGVGRMRTLVFVDTVLLAGTVTAFCGPIGFLGLAVPHIARLVTRQARHGVLMPASMLVGAVVMLGCDVLSSTVARSPLPINVVTALVGVPVIILVVVRGGRRAW